MSVVAVVAAAAAAVAESVAESVAVAAAVAAGYSQLRARYLGSRRFRPCFFQRTASGKITSIRRLWHFYV